jgi:hypothetical protein
LKVVGGVFVRFRAPLIGPCPVSGQNSRETRLSVSNVVRFDLN